MYTALNNWSVNQVNKVINELIKYKCVYVKALSRGEGRVCSALTVGTNGLAVNSNGELVGNESHPIIINDSMGYNTTNVIAYTTDEAIGVITSFIIRVYNSGATLQISRG